MSPTSKVVCPTFHVEQLHDDRAWITLRRSLLFLAKHGGRATAFVSTLGARQEGYDLGERLRWIADQGHEIAMHTHFRRAGQPKHALVTDEDVLASLDADYEYLVGRGHVPRGFCAGGWSIYDPTNEWLSSRGFRYDVSFRSFKLTYDNHSAVTGSNQRGVSVVNRILEIPTTATLKTMLLSPARFRPSLPYDAGAYTLFYLHDWDLLPRRKEILFRLLARRLRGSSILPVQEVVRSIGVVGE